MKISGKWISVLFLVSACSLRPVFGGEDDPPVIELTAGRGLKVSGVRAAGRPFRELDPPLPFLSFHINDTLKILEALQTRKEGNLYRFVLEESVLGEVRVDTRDSRAWKATVTLTNVSDRELAVSNMVPLGQSPDRLHITASGPWSLARSKLFRPGKGPVGVILPDNAWELGYASIPLDRSLSLCLLTRRTEADSARKHRWKTVLQPSGWVRYVVYADCFSGAWQNGLKRIFQERYLFDLEEFDQTLFRRSDLDWIRHDYAISLQFAWDHEFYDALRGGYQLERYLDKGERLFGGWEAVGLWPTWPTLGVDQRNQWDLYADLPGGLPAIRGMAQKMKERGIRFFVAYNPWDQSTRRQDPYEGLARLIRDTDADGVVLDCRGSSSRQLQEAADGVKPGVVMYSEGMAVPKDMPGIVAGRVHDAIYMPPPLNLNKLIKPDFAIFRVCQLNQGRLHREFAFSFFNGYGIEMNVFGPGRPGWIEPEYRYLGRLVRILRENTNAFTAPGWTPLVCSRRDSIWINRWPVENKVVFTVLSLRPEGFSGPLFPASFHPDSHYVSLYHHEELAPDTLESGLYVPVTVNAFDRSWLNTRLEGNVDCVARFPRILKTRLQGDSLFIGTEKGDRIRVWAGEPAYGGEMLEYSSSDTVIRLMDHFDRYEGKFIVQCFQNEDLLDERIVRIEPGNPRLISRVEATAPALQPPSGMVWIEGGRFMFAVKPPDSFIPYPDYGKAEERVMPDFYMDITPVTNAQFSRFLTETGYQPADTVNFLRHWKGKTYPPGKGSHPVVYVSLEDARAYCAWAGKRLPTEAEWQYAAQGKDGRLWPWGAEYDSTRCNHHLGETTPVDAFPRGKSPFGVMDLVGNVWQLTGDLYDNGSHYFVIMRGGSYYNPTSSWWYVKGGPRPLDQTQMLLRVSPGFERNATVGFRGVRDTG
jgi:formylglycine-generating enzyme required for sulfatase activity